MLQEFCLTPSLSRYIVILLNSRVRLWDPGPEAFQNAQRIRLRQYVYFLRYWLERRCQPFKVRMKIVLASLASFFSTIGFTLARWFCLFSRIASILLSWSSPARSFPQIASKSFFCKSARNNYRFIYRRNWLNSLILPLARWFWAFFQRHYPQLNSFFI